MPIRDRDDAYDLQQRIDAFFDADAGDRARVLRGLFVELMDFNQDSGNVPLRRVKNAQLPDSVERIAQLDGVRVYYLQLATKRVTQRDAAAAAKQLSDAQGEDMLLVCTNADASQLHLIHPVFHPKLILRRMVIERGVPQRTAVQQVSNIYWDYQEQDEDDRNLLTVLNRAFDVERVTKDFFRRYHELHQQALELVQGVDGEDAKQFVQTLFNRLMFVYFLSRKGWLAYDGDSDYLNALWRAYKQHPRHDNFYYHRLTYLFFEGLNKSEPVSEGMREIIGKVPFLNGGLFEEDENGLDERAKRGEITVPDDAILPLLTDLFDRFNFTVMESTDLDIEVAVDPEMLGKVFEELVTGRHSKGAYYTPRPVVSFMCREALKGYLESSLSDSHSGPLSQGESEEMPDIIARFVGHRNTDGIDVSTAQKIAAALADVTVVDPACGSGAYLLGMMHELVELQESLFNVTRDSKSQYNLKLEIIQRNLYGVDLDQFAVNIAMLRLWLSLAIDYEGDRPEPLPNLDFKILAGDSLLGPNPTAEGKVGFDRAAIDQSGIIQLKARFLRETDPDRKRDLRNDIDAARDVIRDQLGDANVPEGALDWRIETAEVIAEGGFDIAIANPPYIHIRWQGDEMRKRYVAAGYETYRKMGDVYQLFQERGCQLVRRGGMLAYITSNSWMRSSYGKTTRKYFARQHCPVRWLDLGKDVFNAAIVDSGVLILRTHTRAMAFPAVDLDGLEDKSVPPSAPSWGECRPGSDDAWLVLPHPVWRIVDKMHDAGTLLSELGVTTYIGTMTGCNDAFVIDSETRERLVNRDAEAEQVIKPLLRGRDMQRYRSRWAGMWLINCHNGYGQIPPINIDDYPSIKDHLDGFYDRIVPRQDQGVTPYNLRSCVYVDEFAKEKLFWMDLTPVGRFSYSNEETFCLNTGSMLIGPHLKYLCGMLNSSIVTWFITQSALSSGMGTPRWIRSTVERIPIPQVVEEERQPVEALVDQILAAKDADPDADTSKLEREIDRLAYDLYGLTEEEISAVEARAG